MKNRDVVKLTDQYVAQTYARYPIALVRGKGTRVWDADGKEYLDFLAGIAVNSLGHCHPAVVRAIQQQARKLLHVSNLYHIAPQSELARELGVEGKAIADLDPEDAAVEVGRNRELVAAGGQMFERREDGIAAAPGDELWGAGGIVVAGQEQQGWQRAR